MNDEAERIDAAMDAARIGLGLAWQDIADRAGVGTSSLNRFRRGIGVRTADMTAKIERAYGWPRGYLDAVAVGEKPPEADHVVPAAANELAELRALLAEVDQQANAIRRRLDELDNTENTEKRGA